MNKKILTRKNVLNVIGFILSAYFLYLCIQSIRLEDLKRLFTPNYPWLILAVAFLNVPLMLLRTWIWRLLLQVSRKKFNFRPLWELQNIGFMLNNIFPLKAGDFLKASLASKKWKIPYLHSLTSIGLERYFAGLSLCLLVLCVALKLDLPAWIKTSTVILSFCLLFIQIALMILWGNKIDLKKWEKKHRYLQKIIQQIFHIRESSESLRSPGNFLMLIVLSLGTWFVQLVMLELLERCYGLQVSWEGNILVLAAINIAIILPSAPGNIGTFEFAAMLAFELLGVDRQQGFILGTSFHLLQLIPTTLLGGFYAVASGWRWKKKDDIQSTPVTKIDK